MPGATACEQRELIRNEVRKLRACLARSPASAAKATCGFRVTPVRDDGPAADDGSTDRLEARDTINQALAAAPVGLRLAVCGNEAIRDVAKDLGLSRFTLSRRLSTWRDQAHPRVSLTTAA